MASARRHVSVPRLAMAAALLGGLVAYVLISGQVSAASCQFAPYRTSRPKSQVYSSPKPIANGVCWYQNGFVTQR